LTRYRSVKRSLGKCPRRFDDCCAVGLDELRGDLNRFVFLLGGSDGEQFFDP
jgi:hypothetical protein